ncbi:MAG TPA: CbiX/SirB N-terminal domain-containing protein [Candidatus Binataceae bacterium]|nr:CbiX/SirB N-terminal domain-containing protein [Candidatus Binataceae bacterium]
MQRTGVLVVGHGSREPASNLEFEALVERVRSGRPEFDVRHAYVELATPSLADGLDAIARGNERVVVVPCFLFTAGHVKNDIPLALAGARRKFPKVRFEAGRVLGVHPLMAELAFQRASAARGAEGDPKRTAVVMVGRGSSDPDANGDFCKLVRIFAEGRGFGWVAPAFIGITRPLFDETIELTARARPERILVVPYLLFGGRLVARLEEQIREFRNRYPWIAVSLAAHLGVEPELLEVIDERIREALSGQAPLPCDNCQYRVPVGAFAENVGGFRSLLWSARHLETHAQAMPHPHAHQGMRKHVLVCGNVDCAARGSIALIAGLRRALKRIGREREIRVTRTSCMGRCGEGPTVAVYPDGVWYRGVNPADAKELVEQHLVGDRLVARLIDGIMQ